MTIKFKEELPENLSDKIGLQPKYVAENVTYAPKVTIRNCTFRNVPTRGILCTTRKEVIIENNTFYNMSMATIFLSLTTQMTGMSRAYPRYEKSK